MHGDSIGAMMPREGLKALIVAAALVAGPVAIYATCYFGCTAKFGKVLATGNACRVYRHSWQCLLFMPAAYIETALTGREVTTAYSP